MARTTKGLYFVKTLSGGPPAIRQMYLVTGEAYYEGQVLRATQTGPAGTAAANCTSVLGVLGCNVASADVTSTAKYPVYLLDGNNVFEGQMTATGAPKTRLYDKICFTKPTAGWVKLAGTAYNGAATACLRIIDVNPDDASGTATNKRYWVVANLENSVAGGGGATNAK